MMFSVAPTILHAGSGHEVSFLVYLYRVGLSLIAVGGIALLVYWLLEAVSTFRPAVPRTPDGEEPD